ncbi:MAG: arabinosyltransferase domain-containing protein, partial [Actinomycetota bacterium]|nr:arabinosyltransferase domain-containing protein [Actinomycetota bacterium]
MTALVSGLTAMLAAVLLPFAPVSVSTPTVSWPQDASLPQSTQLMLHTYRPLGLDVRFTCHTVRLAHATPQAIVLATVQPSLPNAGEVGLVVSADGDRISIRSVGVELLNEPIPFEGCTYRVAGDRDTGLVVSRDGEQLAAGPRERLPDVDALVTSIDHIPLATDDDLAVRLRVDDQFSSSPTPIKVALVGLIVLALAVSTAAGVRMDRGVTRPAAIPVGCRARVVDLVVLVVLVGWVFLAPTTDDDGYYSAMAWNYPLEGYIANYYQLYNQSFTPFTWFYVLLAKWQTLGLSPVVMRVPALLAGLLTWLLLRRFVAGCLARASRDSALPGSLRGRAGWVAPWVLAASFLVWWLPQDMGVRPETVVALCGTGALVAVAAAVERRSLALAGTAVAIGALGFAAHPTGFSAVAPLLAAAPAVWFLVLRGRSPMGVAAGLSCVLAPAAVAAIAGFADGTIRDFIASQEIFLSIQDQENWYSEYIRYAFLLDQIAMGSYAKRAPVLVTIVTLVWFVVLVAAARVQRVPVPPRLTLAGWSLGVSLLLLWFTPS